MHIGHSSQLDTYTWVLLYDMACSWGQSIDNIIDSKIHIIRGLYDPLNVKLYLTWYIIIVNYKFMRANFIAPFYKVEGNHLYIVYLRSPTYNHLTSFMNVLNEYYDYKIKISLTLTTLTCAKRLPHANLLDTPHYFGYVSQL